MDQTEQNNGSAWRSVSESGRDARFGRLLAIIVASFMISAISGPLISTLSTILNALLVVVAFRSTGLRAKTRWLLPLAGLAVIAIATSATFDDTSSWQAVPAFAQVLLLGVLVYALLDTVLRRDDVDIQTIVGAISAYMLIGMAYSWLYLGMDILDDTQFSIASVDTVQFPEFSFVVLTTLGFGNQLPTAALSGRLVASEALAGQIFLAVFVARLVALYRRKPASNT